MPEISVIIPNYNGIRFLPGVLDSLQRQTFRDFETILVDNGSGDGSTDFVREKYPEVQLLELSENTGFARAANLGIQKSRAGLVLLLNNDTETDPCFLEEMVLAMRRHPKAFSCCARLIRFTERTRLDSAGDLYCALGWAFARGKGKDKDRFMKEEKVFSSCAAAAVYRREYLEKTGLFDEAHFAYLEDVDLGYRGKLWGYENWYIPSAVVWHIGSATSGSRYNAFKVKLSARNNLYMIFKNMPFWQILLNLPFLAMGVAVKYVFFVKKGFGKDYLAGLQEGAALCRKADRRRTGSLPPANCFRIQLELWKNVFLLAGS